MTGYFTESNQNARAPATAKVSIDGLERTGHSKKNQNRGKVQEARVRAKIAALASKKALNRSKAASKVKQEDESDFVVATTRVPGSDLPCHRAEMTPLSGQQSCLSTPGMTNISQYLFSSNSKSSHRMDSDLQRTRGEEPTVQKPSFPPKHQRMGSVAEDLGSPSPIPAAQASASEAGHAALMSQVDFVSVKQELLQLNKKFTGYWMRTSEGCANMTELIQNVKDESQQVSHPSPITKSQPHIERQVPRPPKRTHARVDSSVLDGPGLGLGDPLHHLLIRDLTRCACLVCTRFRPRFTPLWRPSWRKCLARWELAQPRWTRWRGRSTDSRSSSTP